MKKLLALLLSLTFIFTLSACADKPISTSEDVSSPEAMTEAQTSTSEESSTEGAAETQTTPKWKEFLSEYEAWVDKYVELAKKVSDNPSDLSILSDYTEMAEEALEWQTKADELSAELEEASPAELVEYSAALAKIATKLANAY